MSTLSKQPIPGQYIRGDLKTMCFQYTIDKLEIKIIRDFLEKKFKGQIKISKI